MEDQRKPTAAVDCFLVISHWIAVLWKRVQTCRWTHTVYVHPQPGCQRGKGSISLFAATGSTACCSQPFLLQHRGLLLLLPLPPCTLKLL
jgi:hypothetical protein